MWSFEEYVREQVDKAWFAAQDPEELEALWERHQAMREVVITLWQSLFPTAKELNLDICCFALVMLEQSLGLCISLFGSGVVKQGLTELVKGYGEDTTFHCVACGQSRPVAESQLNDIPPCLKCGGSEYAPGIPRKE